MLPTIITSTRNTETSALRLQIRTMNPDLSSQPILLLIRDLWWSCGTWKWYHALKMWKVREKERGNGMCSYYNAINQSFIKAKFPKVILRNSLPTVVVIFPMLYTDALFPVWGSVRHRYSILLMPLYKRLYMCLISWKLLWNNIKSYSMKEWRLSRNTFMTLGKMKLEEYRFYKYPTQELTCTIAGSQDILKVSNHLPN